MPITLPKLDDRTYASLVDEAMRMIPTLAPDWTDFNPSDPGITLVELLAYLTEMILYRLDRITDANKRAFLKLLNGPDWKSNQSIQDAIRTTIGEIRTHIRAVTSADYVAHALKDTARVARAFCLPNRNLERELPTGPPVNRPGHVSVVIVPVRDRSGVVGEATPDLLKTVAMELEQRRLLTTRVHVVGPRRVKVGVRVTLVLRADAPRTFPSPRVTDLTSSVREKAVSELKSFFDPLSGGPLGSGWPFGRDVFLSEVYQVLGNLPGIDHVTASAASGSDPLDELFVIPADPNRVRRLPDTSSPSRPGPIFAVALHAHELVDIQIDPTAITVETL